MENSSALAEAATTRHGTLRAHSRANWPRAGRGSPRARTLAGRRTVERHACRVSPCSRCLAHDLASPCSAGGYSRRGRVIHRGASTRAVRWVRRRADRAMGGPGRPGGWPSRGRIRSPKHGRPARAGCQGGAEAAAGGRRGRAQPTGGRGWLRGPREARLAARRGQRGRAGRRRAASSASTLKSRYPVSCVLPWRSPVAS